MTDRTVTAKVRAEVGGFVSGINTARTNMVAFNDEIAKSAKKKQALTELGATAGKVGLAAAIGLGVIAHAAMNFDKSMSRVEATGADAAGSMDELRKAAIKAGADTQFSATEAADGITALLKAGVSAKDVLAGGLTGALNLAASGELAVGDAAEIAATALTQFHLSGDQTSHVADLLAAAAGKAQGEVTDMAGALKYVGPVASQMGVSIEETTGTIAELASQGILADQAGTSLRGMLSALTSPSKMAATEMKNLGISMYDANGQFIGFEGIAGQLQTKMKGLTNAERDQALGRIFGNEQITSARILYAGGAAAVDKWTSAVNDQGYAATSAATKMDNLSGDIEQLKGSLETFLIGAGEGSQGPLRTLTQNATTAVNVLNELPAPLKNVAVGMLAITAITGGGLWFGAKVQAGIIATKANLVTLGVTAEGTAMSIRSVALAAGAIGVVSLGLPDLFSETDSLLKSSAAADATATSFDELSAALQASNVGKNAASLGIDVNRLAQDLIKNGESGAYATEVMGKLHDATDGAGDAFGEFISRDIPGYSNNTEKAADASKDLGDIISNNTDIVGKGAEANLSGGKILARYSQAAVAARNASKGEAHALRDATDAMVKKRQASLDALKGEIGYAQAVLDAKQALKDNKHTLDTTKQAGIDNTQVLISLAEAWNGQAPAAKNAKGSYKDARDELIHTAKEFGATRKEARDYADQLLETPKRVQAKVILDKEEASAGLGEFTRELHNLDGTTVNTYVVTTIRRPDGSLAAAGGHEAPDAAPPRKKHRAMGGPTSAGETYWVGENGPEILTMPRNGYVTPNHMLRSSQMMTGGGISGTDPKIAAHLAHLTRTIAGLEARLATLGGDVRQGAAEGSYRGTADRMRSLGAQPYMTTGY